MRMRRLRSFVAASAFVMLAAAPASAHHVVWLDFSLYDLSRHNTVNGNNPPTALDEQLVRDMVIANMMRDYAAYDLTFSLTQPNGGLYTRVSFHPDSVGSPLYGCAGASCCSFGNCTGIGSWDDGISGAEVYVGSFRQKAVWQGANATTQRLANGIAASASHELGHVLGLTHCFAADDYFDANVACSNGFGATTDANQNNHLMATGATGISDVQRATVDRFFSIHSSRRRLATNLQARNQASALGDTNGDGQSDLTYACVASRQSVNVFGRSGKDGALGGVFGGAKLWKAGAGSGFDLYLLGDVTGDGRDDLVVGEIPDAATVVWTVRKSTGGKFGLPEAWSADAGRLGDRFRLGDIDGDGDADLLYGRADSATPSSPLDWYVALSSGSAFGAETPIGNNLGVEDDVTMIGDVNGDGMDDLVTIARGAPPLADVYLSNGVAMTIGTTDELLNGVLGNPDLWMLADVNGDGDDDLAAGTVLNASTVRWEVSLSEGECAILGCFEGATTWNANAGNAGDLFRLGFGPGDPRADLFYGRAIGQDSLVTPVDTTLLRWFARESSGSVFGVDTVYAPDAGAEGWFVP